MKIAITASSPDLDAEVDPRFGRAICFIVTDEEGGDWEAYPNPVLDASGGAGVQATRFIIDKEATVVVSGSFGPNAFETLMAADIEMLVIPTGHSPYAHRRCQRPARENSGKMVTALRRLAQAHVDGGDYAIVLVDGPLITLL